MRIKRLVISGFKSFAETAHLTFGAGITGVVGPNGCGKSNVVDAVRWCMGETSAKHLRGRAMQDVIFAGSIGRTDLPGGSWEQMQQSLARLMAWLPDETEVHCGHGPSTTIGRERLTNPFLQDLAPPPPSRGL